MPAATRMRAMAALLAAAGLASAGARGGSPASADCHRALEALQAQESRVLDARWRGGAAADGASATAALGELKAQRAATARACLGGRGDPPPRTARLLPPLEMPRSTLAPAWRPPAAVSWSPSPVPAAPMPPPPPVDRPVVITHCDPSGCWASDGTWRPRVGATLGGPRGLCTVQGTLVSCP